MKFRIGTFAPAALPGILLFCGVQSLGAATASLFQEAIAGLDGLRDSDRLSTVIADQGDLVGVNITPPNLTRNGADFEVRGGGGSVTAFRDGPPPGGNRDVSGIIGLSTVTVTLQPGETLDYNFEMDYSVDADKGGGSPRLGWLLQNVTTNDVYFEGAEVTTGTSTVLESGRITATTSETVRLSVIANLSDTAMPPNSEASASWETFTFSGDSNIPEPGSTTLVMVAGVCSLLQRRRRS